MWIKTIIIIIIIIIILLLLLKTLLNKILLLQKQVLRFIFFANQRESAIPLFVKANIPPLNIIYFQSVASLFYDFIHENCPDNLLQLFNDSLRKLNIPIPIIPVRPLLTTCIPSCQGLKHNKIHFQESAPNYGILYPTHLEIALNVFLRRKWKIHYFLCFKVRSLMLRLKRLYNCYTTIVSQQAVNLCSDCLECFLLFAIRFFPSLFDNSTYLYRHIYNTISAMH